MPNAFGGDTDDELDDEDIDIVVDDRQACAGDLNGAGDAAGACVEGEASDDDGIDNDLLLALGQSSDEEDDSGAQNLSPHTASRDSRSDVKDIAEEKGETSSALGISEKVRAKTVQYKLEKKAAHAKPTMSFGQKRELSKVFDELSPAFSKVEFAAEQAKRTAEKAALAALPPSTSDRCKFSGLNFRSRDVEAERFDVYMKGRMVLRIGRLKAGAPSTGDWVTIGIIAKRTQKMDKNGGSYCIWRLSDLTRDGNILLFLFGDANQQFWQVLEGHIVAVLNPQPSEDKGRTSGDETLSFTVRDGNQLMKMGKSKDFGFCKSLRNDGQRCQNCINTSLQHYCEYHVHSELKKVQAKRPNLLNMGIGGPGSLQTVHQKKEQVLASKKSLASGMRPSSMSQVMFRNVADALAATGEKQSGGASQRTTSSKNLRSNADTQNPRSLAEAMEKPSFKKMQAMARPGKPSIAVANMLACKERMEMSRQQGKPIDKIIPTGKAPVSVPHKSSSQKLPRTKESAKTQVGESSSSSKSVGPARAGAKPPATLPPERTPQAQKGRDGSGTKDKSTKEKNEAGGGDEMGRGGAAAERVIREQQERRQQKDAMKRQGKSTSDLSRMRNANNRLSKGRELLSKHETIIESKQQRARDQRDMQKWSKERSREEQEDREQKKAVQKEKERLAVGGKSEKVNKGRNEREGERAKDKRKSLEEGDRGGQDRVDNLKKRRLEGEGGAANRSKSQDSCSAKNVERAAERERQAPKPLPRIPKKGESGEKAQGGSDAQSKGHLSELGGSVAVRPTFETGRPLVCSSGCEEADGTSAIATHKCDVCDFVICHICVMMHRRMPQTKEHILLPLAVEQALIAKEAAVKEPICNEKGRKPKTDGKDFVQKVKADTQEDAQKTELEKQSDKELKKTINGTAMKEQERSHSCGDLRQERVAEESAALNKTKKGGVGEEVTSTLSKETSQETPHCTPQTDAAGTTSSAAGCAVSEVSAVGMADDIARPTVASTFVDTTIAAATNDIEIPLQELPSKESVVQEGTINGRERDGAPVSNQTKKGNANDVVQEHRREDDAKDGSKNAAETADEEEEDELVIEGEDTGILESGLGASRGKGTRNAQERGEEACAKNAPRKRLRQVDSEEEDDDDNNNDSNREFQSGAGGREVRTKFAMRKAQEAILKSLQKKERQSMELHTEDLGTNKALESDGDGGDGGEEVEGNKIMDEGGHCESESDDGEPLIFKVSGLRKKYELVAECTSTTEGRKKSGGEEESKESAEESEESAESEESEKSEESEESEESVEEEDEDEDELVVRGPDDSVAEDLSTGHKGTVEQTGRVDTKGAGPFRDFVRLAHAAASCSVGSEEHRQAERGPKSEENGRISGASVTHARSHVTPATTKKRGSVQRKEHDGGESDAVQVLSEAALLARKLAKQAIDDAGGIAKPDPNNTAANRKALTREDAADIAREAMKRKDDKERTEAARKAAKRRCLRNAAGTETFEDIQGDDNDDDGGLEMGWLGTKEAVKKSSNVSIGEVRSSALAGKFAHIYAKLKTEEGQKMLQEGSRYDGLAKEVVEERAERMINKLDESCKLAMQAEGMHEEPCKVFKCRDCGKKDWRPLKCHKPTDKGGSDHSMSVESGFKYWYECGSCRNRDCTVSTLGPPFDCARCGARQWKKSSKGKSKEYVPGSDFKIRGEEANRFHDFTFQPGYT